MHKHKPNRPTTRLRVVMSVKGLIAFLAFVAGYIMFDHLWHYLFGNP